MVPGPARDGERCAGGDDVQAAIRVEDVAEAEQVVVVRAAAMMKNQEPGGVAISQPLAVDQFAHARASVRGLASGVRTRSRWERKYSCWLGRHSPSPRWSASSSTAKPGDVAATTSSKRKPS